MKFQLIKDRMKNIKLAIIAVCFLASCANKDQFVLNGTLKNAGDLNKVLLYEGDAVVDSAFLNENNEFRFRRTAIEPRFYSLVINENQYLLVLENGDKVNFVADFAKDPQQYTITGSAVSQKIQELGAIQREYNKKLNDIEAEYSEKVKADPANESAIRENSFASYQKVLDESSNATLAFAKENKGNLAGFYAMLSLDPARYEQELITYADSIASKFPTNTSVQSFVNHMAELKVLSVGQKAPDFESISPEGKAVKLSDFKGKYTLLDFWASWCGPCREENPNIVAQYDAFKDKGFDVLSVSLDDNRSAWLNGIKEDKLTWTHVSDLQRWNSPAAQLYKINAIPASFLIGPDGVILAKNLRGDSLEEFLSQHLN